MADIGTGDITRIEVTPEGDVDLRCLGKDVVFGHWAAFTVRVPWRHWEGMIATSYDRREEQAQEHIPGT